MRETGRVFRDLGAHVDSIDFPEAAEALRANRGGLVTAAEAYALHRERITKHLDEYDPVVGQRIQRGRDISAWEYVQVMREWEDLRRRAARTLEDVEVILCPTTMIPALPVDEVDATTESYNKRNGQYLRNTMIGNILGLCGLQVPCGFTRAGSPVGLMIYARPFAEHLVLRAGYAYEQAAQTTAHHPPLNWLS